MSRTGILLRRAAAGRPVGAPLDLAATLPHALPVGESSYWLTAWRKPAWDARALNPRGTPKTAGCRPGVARTSQAGVTVSAAGQTYRDKTFTSSCTVNGANALFVNCRFQSSGFVAGVEYSVGSQAYACQVNGALTTVDWPTFIDCEFLGGTNSGLFGGGNLVGCYFAESVDNINLRGDTLTSLAYCVIDGPKRASAGSHCDCIQSTTNSPSTQIHLLEVYRSWIRCTNRFSGERLNRVTQLGSYGDPAGGCTGSITQSWLGGANTYIISYASGAGELTVANNMFGRGTTVNFVSCWYGGVAPADPPSSGNVWDDTLTPVA